MFDREFQIRFTFADLVKLIFFSPLVVVPFIGVMFLPWDSQVAPSWVQAIGSILAIFAAWYIPFSHEQRRLERERVDIFETAGWLALRISNSLDHMAEVISKSNPEDVKRWKFLGQPGDWAVHLKATSELPLVAFRGEEIAYLLALRSTAQFGVECAEIVAGWNFKSFPDMKSNFPFNDRMTFHQSEIEWVMKHTLNSKKRKS